MVAAVVGADAAVAVAVEARHGGLGEEGEGFLEDCWFFWGGGRQWICGLGGAFGEWVVYREFPCMVLEENMILGSHSPFRLRLLCLVAMMSGKGALMSGGLE